MARMPWFRMWSEARNDAKLRRLDDAEFRIWFNLLCYASETAERGVIPACNAYLLAVEVCNADVTLLKRAVSDMMLLRLVSARWGPDEDDQDEVEIVFERWDERQYDKPSDRPAAVAERVKRHRERLKPEASNADVTPRNAQEEIKRREEKKRGEDTHISHPPPAHAREAPTPAVRDVVNAITHALAYDQDARLSEKEHDRLTESATQIVGAGGTPAEVPVRAERYARKYPSIAVTHGGLAGHWGELAVEPVARESPNGRASPVTFAQQIEENNKRHDEEFQAALRQGFACEGSGPTQQTLAERGQSNAAIGISGADESTCGRLPD
jgi:hypothetical protein